MENNNLKENSLHSWYTKEFPYFQKNFAWYVTFVAVAILIVGFYIIQGDYFGAICLGLLSAVALVYANIPPKIIYITLTPQGIVMEDMLIPYAKMRHYWLVDNGQQKTLNVETRAFFQKILVLELNQEDPEKIRDILKNYLPELNDSEPTITQKFMDRFRF